MVLAFLKNVIYPVNRLRRIHTQPRVRFVSAANRYRSIITGQFVTKAIAGIEARRLGTERYWNKIKAIVRAGETRTFSDGRRLYRDYQDRQADLTDEEEAQLSEELFGS